jgi:hypothetical protein
VRVYGNGGVITSKLFSDRLHGGKEVALNKATKFRDQNEKIAKKLKREGRNPNRKPFYSRAPKNNQSGHVGVNEVKTHIRGKEVHYFQATWSEKGKANSCKFYVSKKRTREEAEKLAIKLRMSKENQLKKQWKDMQKEEAQYQKELKKRIADEIKKVK